MCAKCATPIVKNACNTALTAGSLDPKACENGLADPDIERLCGGAPSHGGGCPLLAQMCSKCVSPTTKSACNTALTAGSVDPKACDDALRDREIQRFCK
jgi:hypothetical protein